LFDNRILSKTSVAEPPAVTTVAVAWVIAAVTKLDLVSILKVFAIST
jgi:hypothetical protein